MPYFVALAVRLKSCPVTEQAFSAASAYFLQGAFSSPAALFATGVSCAGILRGLSRAGRSSSSFSSSRLDHPATCAIKQSSARAGIPKEEQRRRAPNSASHTSHLPDTGLRCTIRLAYQAADASHPTPGERARRQARNLRRAVHFIAVCKWRKLP